MNNIITLETAPSTNDSAKDLARGGCAEGTVVRAGEQTAGRGRRGNMWISKPGNLYMSLVLRPGQTGEAGQLSFLAAVALARVLRPLLPEEDEIALKWPNDVLLGGRKVAGILLETETPADWVVAGIGVNVSDAPEEGTSLRARGAETTAEDLCAALAGEIMGLYAAWKNGGFESIRAEWLEQACHVGRRIDVRLPRETLSGVFRGIDMTGALLLDMPDGNRKTIASGEVYGAG